VKFLLGQPAGSGQLTEVGADDRQHKSDRDADDADVLEWEWDLGSSAMEARILRPLVWFGLLESRTEPRSATELVDPRLYRKAPLFDRFVKFNVQIEGPDVHYYAFVPGCQWRGVEAERAKR